MPVKPITDLFTIRESAQIEQNFAQSQSEFIIGTVEIQTQLDTLNREVLLIQEVDFDVAGLPQWLGLMARDGGTNTASDFYINGEVNVILTEVDPAVDPNVLALDSPHFIASRHITSMAGLVMDMAENPDTASYSSVAAADHPLFTSASRTLFLTVTGQYQGNDATVGTAAPCTLRGACRIMAQRGKADADTYAAIVTGLYA